MGLSIATDIVNRHNANLAVGSKLGEGTAFRFLIPLAESNNEVEEDNLSTTSNVSDRTEDFNLEGSELNPIEISDDEEETNDSWEVMSEIRK